MAELQFADGPREVDEPFVKPLEEVCGGDTTTMTFKEAMAGLSTVETNRIVRDKVRAMQNEHLARYGLR